jgi:pilus assembly protein CpaB
MINQRKIFIVAGIALSLIAVFMVKVYVDKEKRSYMEQLKGEFAKLKGENTRVVVAKKDIPEGAAISSSFVKLSVVPRNYLQPYAVTSLDRLKGMVATAKIYKGEQLTLSKIAFSRVAQSRSLSTNIPVGKRAITIEVDNISSLLGMLKPQDYVDVIGIIPMPFTNEEGKQVTQEALIPLFQNVLVLAVGKNIGVTKKESKKGFTIFEEKEKKKKKNNYESLITLALSPREANILAFVAEQGRVRLTLRSRIDSQVEELPPMNWQTFFQFLMERGIITPPPAKVEEKKGPTIEIYKGSRREEIPIGK